MNTERKEGIWEHEFAYMRDGHIIDLVAHVRGAKVAIPQGWQFPMPTEEYIARMSETGDGYQFGGSYPFRDGTMIVMKRWRTEFLG
jgi:hypothetical protein